MGERNEMKAIFLAAGEGKRIKNDIKEKCKCLTHIEGKTLLYSSIIKMIKSININEIIIVVGENESEIRSSIGNVINDIKVKYIKQEKRNGILGAINTVIDSVNEDVVIQLGDEYYEKPRYYEMYNLFKHSDCVFGIIEADEERIRNNYSIRFEGDKPIEFVEKPIEIVNNFAGTGLMMISAELLKYLRTLYEEDRKYDLVDFFNWCLNQNIDIKGFVISDYYMNINTIKDLDMLIEHLDNCAKTYFFDEYYELYAMHRTDILVEQFYQGKFAEVYEAMCNIRSDSGDVVDEYDESIYFEEIDIYKRYLAECRGDRVLELACGSGRITARLACERIYITGVDNSQMMLEILNDKMHLEHKKYCKYLNIINDDITTLMKVSDKFDLVILPATTIRLIDMELSMFLKHIYRYIKPGGFFIFDIIEPKCKTNEIKTYNKYSLSYEIDSIKNIMFFEERHDFAKGKTRVNFYLNTFGKEIKHYLSYTYLNLIDRKRVIDAVKNTKFSDVIFEEYADDKYKKIFFCVLRK